MAEANRYDGENFLPEIIIQHIQSLLSGKEAARTTILSKAWYSAWLTRPNLVFNFRDGSFRTALAFLMFAKKTIQRYETLNLRVESFRLCMTGAPSEEGEFGKHNSFPVADELIVKAIKLGATDLNIEVDPKACLLDLPQEVLGSENLIRLTASGCNIYRGKVSCSKLKSLNLRRVYIIGPLIWDICSSCPLIEELSFSVCMLKLPIPRMTLFVRALPLSPVTDFIEQLPDVPIIPWYEFNKLERLFLEKLDFDSSFFHDFSSKFRCLKDLTLDDCGGFKSIQISSPSLECITIVEVNLRFANLDVPNIRQFTFNGSKFPCLCFKTTSREWKSNISITYREPVDSWFVKLKKFLKRLSSSKITLSLKFLDSRNLLPKPFDAGGEQSLSRPWVENLLLSADHPSSELLNGLFWSCRPKLITGYESFLCTVFLWDTLAQERSESYFDDLVEVNVEIFEESVAEWRPITWKTLKDAASASLIYTRKIRFQLIWGSEPSTST